MAQKKYFFFLLSLPLRLLPLLLLLFCHQNYVSAENPYVNSLKCPPSLKAEIVPFISETKSSVHIIAIEQIFAANKIIDIMSAFIVQEAHKPGTLKTISEPAVTSVTLSLLGQPPFMSSPSAQVQWDPHSDTVVLSTCSEGTWFITREGG